MIHRSYLRGEDGGKPIQRPLKGDHMQKANDQNQKTSFVVSVFISFFFTALFLASTFECLSCSSNKLFSNSKNDEEKNSTIAPATTSTDTGNTSTTTETTTSTLDTPVPPVTALVDITESRDSLITSIQTNAGFKPIYKVTVPNVAAGDILRIYGQLEITNNDPDFNNVYGLSRILVNGNTTGALSAQYTGGAPEDQTHRNQSHHMPFWNEAVYIATSAGDVTIQLEYSAAHSNSNIAITVENGAYGHLYVEQYKYFESKDAALAANTYHLENFKVDSVEKASIVLEDIDIRTLVYGFNVDVKQGDILHLFGQGNVAYINGREMHGQAIYLGHDANPFGSAATENDYWDVQFVPAWSHAIHRPATTGELAYSLKFNGVMADVDLNVLIGCGYLAALRFSPITSSTTVINSLKSSLMLAMQADDSVVSNSGEHEFISQEFDASVGDIIKSEAQVSLFYPTANFTLPIGCVEKTDLVCNDQVIASSPFSEKAMFPNSPNVTLHTQLFKKIENSGTCKISAKVYCLREGASPTVSIIAGGTQLLLETFQEVK